MNKRYVRGALLLIGIAILLQGHLNRQPISRAVARNVWGRMVLGMNSRPFPKRAKGTPKPDHPGEAVAFRNLQLSDENGFIVPDGLLQARAHMDAMRVFQAQQPCGVAGAAGITPASWTWLGPGNIGGRVRSIVINPTTPTTWIAGSVSGGIWRTTNSGGSWSPVDDFMANLAISTMVMQPGTPNTIYAGTGEVFYNIDGIRGAGIFKSTNGGTNWAQLASTNNSTYQYVNRLAMSADGGTLIAATRTGIYRSTDGGTVFSPVLAVGDGYGVMDADFHPSDNTKAVASGKSGTAWYTTNGGTSWTPATGLPGTFGRVEIAYAPSNPAIVYTSTEHSSGSLYKSIDGGVTYTLVFNGAPDYLSGQGWYDNALWVDPTNADFLIVGGVDLYKSSNGGVSWTQISVWYNAPSSAHADHHVIVALPGFDGTTNTTVIFGNDGGVYSTSNVYTVGNDPPNYTAGWVEKNNTLGITQFYGAAGNNATGVIVGGTQDNGTLRYTTGGGTEGHTTMFGGDGGFNAADQANSNYFYGEYVYLNIHRSSNAGVFSDYINGLFWNGSAYVCKAAPYVITDSCNNSQANFIAPFILDPNNPLTLLGGAAQLWRTNDARTANILTTGPTWASIKSGTGSDISAIAVAPGNSNICWVGHNNGDVYFATNCTNATPTWTKVDANATALPNRFVQRITIDPNDTNRVYVAFGGYSANNLWRTANSGTAWASVSGSGPTALPAAPVRDLDIKADNSNWLYAATEVGILTSEDMVAATHGRGIYKTTSPVTEGTRRKAQTISE